MQERLPHTIQRLNDTTLTLKNSSLPVRIFANAEVPIERGAVAELETLLGLQATLARLYTSAPHLCDEEPTLTHVALSSDFHRGRGIPIGTTLATQGVLIPGAMGSDVNCGMRVHRTTLTAEQVLANKSALVTRLRRIFFGGGRQIALTAVQREAMLSQGIPGLIATGAVAPEMAHECDAIVGGGGATSSVPAAFTDYIRGASPNGASFDAHLGSLGGGNHFAEIQVVKQVLDKATAFAWGLTVGQVIIMIHSGSLGFGQRAQHISTTALRAHLPQGLAAPHELLPLPLGAEATALQMEVGDAIQSAANFAFCNRLYLAQMVADVLASCCGGGETPLLYDAPHNFVWQEGSQVIHRKGSTPCRAAEQLQDTPFPWGEPVIVPGSMGASSFILRSIGQADALYSACHGAGRAVSRGDAQQGHDDELDAFLERFTVVTPVDEATLRARRDLRTAWRQQMKQEAPFAYKGIGPVIATLEAAGISASVVELEPLLTIKS